MKLKLNFNSDILRMAIGRTPRTMMSLQKTLDDSSLARLPVGVQARVIAINGSNPVARRLMEMGVVPGAPVRVIKTAPLGDPMEIRIRGYHLALRRTEAQTITVTAVTDNER